MNKGLELQFQIKRLCYDDNNVIENHNILKIIHRTSYYLVLSTITC